jgi:DNA-binding CsgD family transcriptional regulator
LILKHEDLQTKLMAQFGVTSSEAIVAVMLWDGAITSEIATQRLVSAHTVRNQVKSAMAKISVRRQADLTRIVQALYSKTD